MKSEIKLGNINHAAVRLLKIVFKIQAVTVRISPEPVNMYVRKKIDTFLSRRGGCVKWQLFVSSSMGLSNQEHNFAC